MQIILFACAAVSAVVVLAIFYALFNEGAPVINNWIMHGFGMYWNGANLVGVIPLIFTTFYFGFGCTLVATAIGLPCAIYLAEFADERIRNIVKPSLEVLTGIPSVIFGLIGIALAVEAVSLAAGGGTGGGMLTIWIVVGVMSLPTVASISEDAIRAVPKDLREASLGLGATRWQTTEKVVIPVAIPGILTAVLLGMGNAVGETMAVLMIIGANPTPPISLDILHNTGLIPPVIVSSVMGEAGYQINRSIAALAVILFVIIAVLNLMIRAIIRRGNQQSGANKKN